MNKAKSLAAERLRRTTRGERATLRVLDERTECRRSGWIFFYEGRGPVMVSHEGDVHLLEGDRPLDEALRELEAGAVTRF